MKTSKNLVIVFAAVFAIAFSFSSCKKDKTSATDVSLATTDVNQATDAESQDAISDKVENDADNDIETVKSSDFDYTSSSSLKSASFSKTVTIDHPSDTINWPKVITIVYDWKDTVNEEISTKTGTVVITLDLIDGLKKYGWRFALSRKIEFQNLTITTAPLSNPNDVSSVTINGTKSVVPATPTITIINDNEFKLSTVETVTTPDSMKFTLKYDDFTRTISRFVNRTRTVELYYKRIIGTKRFRPEYSQNSLTIDGTVTGINAAGKPYTRDITTPLVIEFAKVWPYNPVITSGVITQTIGDKTATFTYSAVGNKTQVTIEKNGKTKTITRTICRRISKWW